MFALFLIPGTQVSHLTYQSSRWFALRECLAKLASWSQRWPFAATLALLEKTLLLTQCLFEGSEQRTSSCNCHHCSGHLWTSPQYHRQHSSEARLLCCQVLSHTGHDAGPREQHHTCARDGLQVGAKRAHRGWCCFRDIWSLRSIAVRGPMLRVYIHAAHIIDGLLKLWLTRALVHHDHRPIFTVFSSYSPWTPSTRWAHTHTHLRL